MGMSKIAHMIAISIAIVGGSGSQWAHATTITFEGFSNTIFGDEVVGNGLAVGSNGGFDFTSSGDHFHFLDSTAFPGLVPNNGTGVLDEDRNYSITMVKSGGGSFDLQAIGYAGRGGSGVSATSLVVTGFFAAGGSTSSTLSVNGLTWLSNSFAGFTGLNSVVFDGAGGAGNFCLDNISVVPTPEPSTLLLLSIGAISLLGYRKAKSHG
jgi:PEP-CTERM motif